LLAKGLILQAKPLVVRVRVRMVRRIKIFFIRFIFAV
jgi:hypothetical protein